MVLSDDETLHFLAGGGEMGAIIRSKDWGETAVGPPSSWPTELRIVIRLMLSTNHPIFVFWGPELTCFYNDAYSAFIGPERHPGALGRPGREVLAETWPVIGPQIDTVMSGRGATWHEDHLVPITRHGVREDVYWTYSFSPIDRGSAENGVDGVLVICNETTRRIRIEQQLEEELMARAMLLREVNHRIKNSLQLVSTLLRLEGRAAKSDETRTSLKRASARVDAIGAVHELIYRADDIETVEIEDYISELCNGISDGLAGGADITLDCDAQPMRLRTDIAITVALLVNELVTNCYKHAFSDGRGGTIRVRTRGSDDILRILVADDGVGKMDGAPQGLGSRIVNGLVKQLNAKVSEGDDTVGYSVEVTIPI